MEESTKAQDHKVCPWCAETIKRAAIICRFCNRDVAAFEKARNVQSNHAGAYPAQPLSKDRRSARRYGLSSRFTKGYGPSAGGDGGITFVLALPLLLLLLVAGTACWSLYRASRPDLDSSQLLGGLFHNVSGDEDRQPSPQKRAVDELKKLEFAIETEDWKTAESLARTVEPSCYATGDAFLLSRAKELKVRVYRHTGRWIP